MNSTRGNDDTPSLRAPLGEALGWFARLQNGHVSAKERADFAAWLAASSQNAEAYARAEALWQSPELPAALSHFAHEAIPPVVSTRRQTVFRRQRWAAAATIVLFAGWTLVASGLIDRWRSDYATMAGEQRRIILADGSAVTLNTDSLLALDDREDQRGVKLLAGEAYFEVQPDSARPFIVRTSEGTVRVVGTHFSVRAGDFTSVKVESGIVACSNGKDESVHVIKGQQAIFSNKNITTPLPFDPVREFAWLKGRLIFKDEPLAQVIGEVDRYHPGKILIVNPQLAQITVTGNYKISDTTAVINALAEATSGRITTVSPYLTILR